MANKIKARDVEYTFEEWRLAAAAQKRKRDLLQQAAAHFRMHLEAKALATWRSFITRTQQLRAVTAGLQMRQLKRAFNTWRGHRLERLADAAAASALTPANDGP